VNCLAELDSGLELIITGRGGGSAEDLQAFNDEKVARAIAGSRLPVISAVGHEPDVTIADYAADMRASTPSNAAELAVPDRAELARTLSYGAERLQAGLTRRLRESQRRLEQVRRSRALSEEPPQLARDREEIDRLQERMSRVFAQTAAGRRQTLTKFAASLDILSPLRTLGRGYAIAQPLGGGAVLRSVEELEAGQELSLRLTDGSARCRVEETRRKLK
jgi:exodeoxyribonuclease VII large subunit